jgi:hypothetical protein
MQKILWYNPAALKKAHLARDGQQASLSGFLALRAHPAKLILFHANLRVWEQHKLRSNKWQSYP